MLSCRILTEELLKIKKIHLLVENELNKLKTFDSSYFIGKSHFEEDGVQNFLVFQPLNKYFKVITNTDYVSSWKSKGLSAEGIKLPTASGVIKTNVLGNNNILKENMHYICIACITIDSVLRIDKKNHPQVYLEVCKYKAKKYKCLNL